MRRFLAAACLSAAVTAAFVATSTPAHAAGELVCAEVLTEGNVLPDASSGYTCVRGWPWPNICGYWQDTFLGTERVRVYYCIPSP